MLIRRLLCRVFRVSVLAVVSFPGWHVRRQIDRTTKML